ncbi:MAG: M42 family peptidase [Clostridia bacterium]|nr:M42 family peptidase [Clostridia bacterium]
MKTDELCFALAAADGTPGDEFAACKVAEKYINNFMNIEYTKSGSLIATANEKGKVTVLLDAHIDRVGLVVRGIDENGFILIDKVGGLDCRTIIGAEVILFGKKNIKGVICSSPPHLQKGDEKKNVDISSMAVDVCLSKEEAEEIISFGDRGLICSKQVKLLGNKIASSALDDRCGVAALIIAANKVKDKLKNVKLCLQLSSQEEVGGAGAKTAAFALDADYAIAVDVGFGSDRNYSKGGETISLGGGASIGISPVLNRELTDELISLAKKNSIDFQHDVMSRTTGTNADQICVSKSGVKTALLSIPLRNMHTAVEVIDLCDVEKTAELISLFILSKEAEFDD